VHLIFQWLGSGNRNILRQALGNYRNREVYLYNLHAKYADNDLEPTAQEYAQLSNSQVFRSAAESAIATYCLYNDYASIPLMSLCVEQTSNTTNETNIDHYIMIEDT